MATPHLGRRAVRGAGDAHQAGARLDEEIVPGEVAVRARSPEAGDRGVDQPWVALAQGIVAEAARLQPADAEVFEQHVGGRGQVGSDFAPARRRQVEGDAALVAVRAR